MCRSRTLLHFVAREVARQHPDGASLAAELPSAAAAAQLDLGAAVAELEGLAVEGRELQAALAAGGSSCVVPSTAFQAAVMEQLVALQAQLDEAQAAFKCVGAGWDLHGMLQCVFAYGRAMRVCINLIDSCLYSGQIHVPATPSICHLQAAGHRHQRAARHAGGASCVLRHPVHLCTRAG